MLLTKTEIENNNSEHIENSDMFEKFSNGKKLSLKTIRESITSPDENYSSTAKMLFTLIFGCAGITAIYTTSLLKLGLFNINSFLSVFLTLSCFVVFYGSAFVLGKVSHSKKIFKFQKEDVMAKKLFENFLSSDTRNILTETKSSLLEQLDRLDIKKHNAYVYDFIYHDIMNLDGDFSRLQYEIEQNIQREKYSFEPFRTFLNVVDNIDSCIVGAKDIKVINE